VVGEFDALIVQQFARFLAEILAVCDSVKNHVLAFT
jgi:hypothetical protein